MNDDRLAIMVMLVVPVIVVVVMIMVVIMVVSLRRRVPRNHLDAMMVSTTSLHNDRMTVPPIDEHVHIVMIAVVVVPPLRSGSRLFRLTSLGPEEGTAERGERAGECAASLGLGVSGRVNGHWSFAVVR